MKKTILVIGIACATMMAVAQSDAPQDNSAQTNSVVRPRDAATGMASGKTMAADDWNAQQKTKGSMSGAQSNPMYQESGNSGTNPLYQGSNRNATKTRSNIQNNRVAAGDVDGDGAADNTVVKSKSNITNNRVAAGDVNRDGTPDGTVSPEPAQMKGDFSRGHQPDRKAPAAANSSAPRDAQSGMATGKRQHN